MLRRVKKEESIELLIEDKTAQLKMILRGDYTKTFIMSTLEELEEEVPTPNISFNAKAKLTTAALKEAIRDVLNISDQVSIQMTDKKFIMDSKGRLGSVSIEIPKESKVILDYDVEADSRATFSLNYLSEMVKAASNLSEIAIIELSSDMPIRLNFELPQGGNLQYYLAPRIENP
jgi:proliferating cell nuclear antigen